MSVICITRELAALGDETAREFANLNGYRNIERDYIESRLAENDIGPDELARYDEKRPGLWASMSENRDRYLHFLKTILYDEAFKGNCVIIGRGGGAVLAGVPNVVSVRLVAPHAVRLERIKTAHSCDAKSAEHQIKQSDHDREGFHRYFFGIDWKDASLYDLVINTGKINPAGAAKIIENYRLFSLSPEDEKNGQVVLEERRLKTAVIGEITYKKGIHIQSLEVTVEGRRITLLGFAPSRNIAAAAIEAARGVKGAEEVLDDIHIMPTSMGS
jgi:cytidylate kinase